MQTFVLTLELGKGKSIVDLNSWEAEMVPLLEDIPELSPSLDTWPELAVKKDRAA